MIVTLAFVPGAPVVTVPIVKVGAGPVAPVAPVEPVGPVGRLIKSLNTIFYNNYKFNKNHLLYLIAKYIIS